MTPDHSHLRVSDRARDAFAARLRDAHTDGRLTIDEFHQRIDAVYEAKTYAEVEALIHDLPESAATTVEAEAEPGPSPDRTSARGNRVMRVLWIIWACIVFVDLTIWSLHSIASGRLTLFWPIWLAVPGLVLLSIHLVRKRG
jgi:hypothetical protein